MEDAVERLSTILREEHLILACAESCTGGMIAAAMTDLAGSSAIFDRGFVTYSNAAKQDMLGVHAATLEDFGAVSEQCAGEMAQGALKNSAANIAVAVTGIAGPDGGSDEKPVGLVYVAVCLKGKAAQITRNEFHGDRASVRALTCSKAFDLLIKATRAV